MARPLHPIARPSARVLRGLGTSPVHEEGLASRVCVDMTSAGPAADSCLLWRNRCEIGSPLTSTPRTELGGPIDLDAFIEVLSAAPQPLTPPALGRITRRN
jgi:hypothetical protein